jgi:hypothetical protein
MVQDRDFLSRSLNAEAVLAERPCRRLRLLSRPFISRTAANVGPAALADLGCQTSPDLEPACRAAVDVCCIYSPLRVKRKCVAQRGRHTLRILRVVPPELSLRRARPP